MANIFPRWTNWLPLKLFIAALVLGAAVVWGVTYYFTPKYTRVGYMPQQPVNFEHAIHVNQLGMDCRYCHVGVETSPNSTIPTTQTCMNCHKQVKKDSPALAAVRESWETGKPIPWVRIHQVPDYVYFNHAAHVNRGVSCVSCHGQVNQMRVMYQDQPQSMSWCLECHRSPEKKIRPMNEVYHLDWKPESEKAQLEMGKKLVKDWNIDPPKSCAGCHR
ncbi:MAG: cytochrome c3 family protein [Verrucomicrobiia bacterium]